MRLSAHRLIAAVATVTASATALAIPPSAWGQDRAVRVATSGNDSELRRAIPIGEQPGDRRKVVMSVGRAAIGELRSGDRIETTAEVEVSVCLKANPLHRGSRPCIGKTYGYDPRVQAQLVLADGGSAVGRRQTVALGRDRLTCHQVQPNRNHHCVLVIPRAALAIDDVSTLPCMSCDVNLVLSAWARKAQEGHKLVVGAASNGRDVNGDKGRVNVIRYRPGAAARRDSFVASDALRNRLPVARDGAPPKERALYSIELENLRAGEQLVVDAKLIAKVGNLPYNVFQTTSLVLSERPDSASREGWPERVGDLNGQVAEANGFNCTQGRSAHANPCVARKVGVLEITRDSPRTLYLNLVAGMAAKDTGGLHHGADRARILDRGFLRLRRYSRSVNDDPPATRGQRPRHREAAGLSPLDATRAYEPADRGAHVPRRGRRRRTRRRSQARRP